MPIQQAAFKHQRQTKKRTLRNQDVKENLKFLIKKLRQAIAHAKTDEAADFLKKTVKALDQAAQQKIIKKNTAARKKSRLVRQYNLFKKPKAS